MTISTRHKRLLMRLPSGGLPRHAFCRAQCAFCYEARIAKLFPWVKVIFLPQYSEESFRFYESILALHRFENQGGDVSDNTIDPWDDGAFVMQDGQMVYYPNCDFFCLGLKHSQIEKILQQPRPERLKIYTTGLGADPDFVKFLFRKYSKLFTMHLSIVSFDAEIRKRIMHPETTISHLQKLCAVSHDSTAFIIMFHKRQVLDDLGALQDFVIHNHGRIYLHKLYFNRLDDSSIAETANEASRQRGAILKELKKFGPEFLSRTRLSPGADLYAERWRDEIAELLEVCNGDPTEVIFCSLGAEPTISSIMAGKGTRVRTIDSLYGGNIDFIQSASIDSIHRDLKEMAKRGELVRTVFIPSSLFFVRGSTTTRTGRYDLTGKSPAVLEEAFPDISFRIIEVPNHILMSTITLDQIGSD